MSLSDIQAFFEGFRRKYSLSELQLCNLSATAAECSDQSEIIEAFRSFNPVLGWAQCQSTLELLSSGTGISDWSPILYAEFINMEARSLHIQWSSFSRSWRVTQFSDVAGEQYLYDEVSLHAEKVPGNVMRYRRYWRDDDGMRPFASRFIGFGDRVS